MNAEEKAQIHDFLENNAAGLINPDGETDYLAAVIEAASLGWKATVAIQAENEDLKHTVDVLGDKIKGLEAAGGDISALEDMPPSDNEMALSMAKAQIGEMDIKIIDNERERVEVNGRPTFRYYRSSRMADEGDVIGAKMYDDHIVAIICDGSKVKIPLK